MLQRFGCRRPYVLLTVLFLATLPLVNPYLRGDGVGYYAWLRSPLIDGDFDFRNEYLRAEPSFVRSVYLEDDFIPDIRLPNERVRNQWAVGPAMLWLPAFAIAHVTALGLRAGGAPIATDGYSTPYLLLCALSTAVLGFLSLLLGYSLARRYVQTPAALLAVLGVWFASSLPVYMYFLPFQAHAPAAFGVALFFWYGVRTRERRSVRQWIVWGAIGGLMIELYFINAVFVFFLWAELARTARSAGARRALVAAGAAGAAAALVMLPHFLSRWYQFGTPFTTGYIDKFVWSDPRLWSLAFSAEHGLFSWTPLLLVAMLGLVLLWRRDRWLAGSVLASFAAFYYIVAAHDDWHGISSFGNRFFVSFTPLFILGLAVVLARIAAWVEARRTPAAGSRTAASAARPAYVAAGTALALLAAWNFGFILQWGTNVVPNRGPVDFGEVARNQVTIVPQRIVDTGLRYLTSRREMTRELEEEDMREVRAFTAER